jgi:hypothetical protein
LPCAAVACALLAAVAPTPATASEEPERPWGAPPGLRAEILGGAGFGDARISTGETLNAYRGAIGLRAGWTLPFGGHLAVRYDHFFGSASLYAFPSVARVEYAVGASFLGVDAGFEIALPGAFFRPHVGLGAGLLRHGLECAAQPGGFGVLSGQFCAVEANKQPESAWRFAAVPGLTMAVTVWRLYVLVEPRYYLRSETSAFGAFGGVGSSF